MSNFCTLSNVCTLYKVVKKSLCLSNLTLLPEFDPNPSDQSLYVHISDTLNYSCEKNGSLFHEHKYKQIFQPGSPFNIVKIVRRALISLKLKWLYTYTYICRFRTPYFIDICTCVFIIVDALCAWRLMISKTFFRTLVITKIRTIRFKLQKVKR